MYLKECKSGYNKGTCTPMFTAALLTIAKLWKQSWCSNTDEWIKKMWYLYTMEFYSATTKKEILSFSDKWMKLENIILSEVSQVQKAKSCIFSLKCWIQTRYKYSKTMKKQAMLRGDHIQEREGKRRKLRRWILLMYSLYKNEYRIFKLVETTIRKGLR
jgi:hypothetical protein